MTHRFISIKLALCWSAFKACGKEGNPPVSYCDSMVYTNSSSKMYNDPSVTVCKPAENLNKQFKYHKICGPSEMGRLCIDLPQTVSVYMHVF